MSNENDDEIDTSPSIYDEDGEEDKSLFRWMNAFVVLLAVAGFFGLAWYAYKGGDQAVDESQVEMVKADAAPVKEAPANPGGMQIPNQDKTVYGLINGDQAQKPVAERILPAPEQPVDRTGGDTESWMSDKVKQKDAADATDAQPPAPPVAPAALPQKKAEQFNPAKVRMADAGVAAQRDAEVKKASGGDLESGISNAAPAAAAGDGSKPPAPLPAVTPPATTAATPKADAKIADAADGNGSEDSAAATAGDAPAAAPQKGSHAQLGAYKSEAEAKARWAKIAAQFADDLKGKQHIVARADLGSRGVFYRLQVGPFASAGQAEEFCLSFVSAGQGCFAVNTK